MGARVKSGGLCVGSAGLSDTNMLVSPTQNGRVGGLNQHEWFRVAVEYRIYTLGCLYFSIEFWGLNMGNGTLTPLAPLAPALLSAQISV